MLTTPWKGALLIGALLAASSASEARASSEGEFLRLEGAGLVVPALAIGMTFAIIDIRYGALEQRVPAEVAIAQLLIATPLWAAIAFSNLTDAHTTARVLSGGVALWFTSHGLWSLFSPGAPSARRTGRPQPRARDVPP